MSTSRTKRGADSQDEVSEEWVGEWMEERGNRDQLVIATKVFTVDFFFAMHTLGAHLYAHDLLPSTHATTSSMLPQLNIPSKSHTRETMPNPSTSLFRLRSRSSDLPMWIYCICIGGISGRG